MKLLTALIAALSFSASATDVQTEMCDAISGLAKEVMEARQTGMPMGTLIKLANDAGDLKPFYTHVIISAYDLPRFSVKENQVNAINDFTNEVYLTCAKFYAKES